MSDQRKPPPAPDWQPLQLSALRQRLAEVRDLLRQAAAVGLAQDTARLEKLTEIASRGARSGDPQRRRYR